MVGANGALVRRLVTRVSNYHPLRHCAYRDDTCTVLMQGGLPESRGRTLGLLLQDKMRCFAGKVRWS